ncbi:MAG: hypothetical protein HC898_12600 [Phycisphaerales bacterium]|nr:hypothetical protein [Phycisphaerales bacterium]
MNRPIKVYSPEDIRAMLGAASIPMRAMVLLGINAALGATDISLMLDSHIQGEFLVFPRHKTGIARRCWLWPETLEAIRRAREVRHEPQDPKHQHHVFITAQATYGCAIGSDVSAWRPALLTSTL